MKNPKETTTPEITEAGKSTEKPQLARRAILKGAVGTMPAILTLQSGAALARSSNLITPVQNMDAARNEAGDVLCLSESSVTAVYPDGRVDLGESPTYGYVNEIPERDYFSEANAGSDPISEAQMCLEGKTGYFNNMGFRGVTPDKGWLVSMDSLNSFGDAIKRYPMM